MARDYIQKHSKEFGVAPYHKFNLSFTKKSLSGETLRFQQMINDIPVFQSEIIVHFNTDKEISYASNKSFKSSVENINTNPAITKNDAVLKSNTIINNTDASLVVENKLYVIQYNGTTKLAYRIVTETKSGAVSWENMIDAQTGDLISSKDIAIYHKDRSTKKKENKALTPFSFVTGTAMVYMSDPLSQAGVAYGATGYVDGNDANTTQLANARTAVSLPEIDLTSGVYKLKSSFAEISDFESPNKGLFTQSTSDFNFTRDNDAFEAVNTFYQLDKALRYINITLGIQCKPSLNNGVLLFDPSGLSGADNSHYLPASDKLAFGEGCVDDAEDADVIWHEFGHGVHDWMTNGNSSSSEGLGEGNGDYWAQSYSRSLNQWTSSQAAYQYMFSWDGHNTCWAGRTTNYATLYPNLVGAIHTDGQIWATALMKIWDAIGRTKTDKAFLEGLSLTDSSSGQNDAAIAVRQAAIDMNYPCVDIKTITTKFTDAGYTLPTLGLTMATIANQTVSAGSNNLYTIPNYNVLANPITENCDATITQSPAIGTNVAPNTYTISVTATSGSSSVTRTFQLTVTPFLGTQTFSKNTIQLYPNPVTSELFIKGIENTNDTLSVYNMIGQKVIEQKITETEAKVNVAHLSEGLYTVQFQSDKSTYKFIKK